MQRRMRSGMIGLLLSGIIFASAAFSQQVGTFVKYEGNPILQPQGTGFEQKAVFNPAAIVQNDTIYLFYRAQDINGTSRIGLAKSTDGINFIRRTEPVISPEYDYETPGGCEDPRIVKVEDTYYITYTGYSTQGTPSCLATSSDLVNWTKYGQIVPKKSAAILNEKINDKYWLYYGDTNMWIAYSDDLIHWTVDSSPVMRPRSGYFDANLVEPGPPPLITEQGILLFYNGSSWKGEVSAEISRAWDVDISADGNYAYIPGKGANNATVWIINVSDPAHPTMAYTIAIATPAGKAPEAWGVQVVGNLLYVAAFQAGFWIYDITDPVNPAVVGSLVDNSTESRDLHVVGNYAYVADAWNGLSIVDITNPANPTRISLYNTDKDIGRGNTDKKAEFHDVKVINDTAYCAGGNYGLVIVDVTNPADPNGVSFCCDCVTQPRYPSGTYDWCRGVEVSGNYAYLSDNHAGLRIVDISNPAAPTEAGAYYISNGGELWKTKVIGDTLYVPYDKSGLIILDVNNPENPIELGSYPGNYQEVSIRGNIAYIVEESSFWTFDISDPASITQIGRLSSGRFVEYATGWALFSIDNPAQILVRSNEAILSPTEEWEIQGQVPHVVFSEGLVNYNDTWYLYYGGADSRIGVASCEGPIITVYDDPLTRLGVILQPQGNGFERDRVFNPSVIVEADTMHMIYRAEGTPGGSFMALAKSTNGVNFTRYAGNPLLHGEDPRIVKFDDTYYLFYGYIFLATSTDMINWTEQGTVLVPVNDWESAQVKAPAPVPEKINGKYWMYYQGEKEPWKTKMGLAYSDDRVNWTHLPNPVMTPRMGYFDSWGTEPGVVVIIDEGIFMIYNGWGGDGTNRNQVGWAIFDREDPSSLIARCDSPIISLSHDHVFCEGLVEFNDQWYLYWGAADQWIEGAIIDIDKIISGAVNVAATPDYTPSAYFLMQNYPNPFNPVTVIHYYLPIASRVSLKVYNLLGQEIKTLVNENRGIGAHSVIWDATDNFGEKLGSGVYVYTLEVEEFKMVKKMILIR